MLVDSGSSASFISKQVVSQIAEVQALPQALQVKIADGGVMSCTKLVKECSWYCRALPSPLLHRFEGTSLGML